MGANWFEVYEEGHSPMDAFIKARREASIEFGCRGYTGTIAEKHRIREFNLPEGIDLQQLLGQVQMEDISGPNAYLVKRICNAVDDKWGPAGCIFIKDIDEDTKQWVFFGWASS